MDRLEFAIKMEKDGVKYYKKQAQLNESNRLRVVFEELAKEEANHASMLQKCKAKEKIESGELKKSSNVKSVYEQLEDYKPETKEKPEQIDAYRDAAKKEQKSIALYMELANDADTEQEKELFAFLIDQEKKHLEVLESLIILVSRPDEWVESAEFGLRDDY